MAQSLSTPDPSLSPTHLSIRRGRTTTTHNTHHQVSLMVSGNTTLVRDVPLSDENSLTYCHSIFTVRQPNHSSFISIKHLHEIPTRSPPVGMINTGVV